MHLHVLAVGRLRPPFADDVQHYRTLLARHAQVKYTEVREDEKVAPRVPDRAYVVLLDREGQTMDSIQFSEWLEQRRQGGRDVAFVIGGPKGLDLEADLRLSFGPMTLPYQLARVTLLEQLYRAHKILAGEPYHY